LICVIPSRDGVLPHHEAHEGHEGFDVETDFKHTPIKLRDFHTTMVQNFRSLRKFLGNSDSDIYLAKTPRAPSSELLFSFAAFASLRRRSGHALREIFRHLVAALPR
jgi:hypothetical protein